MAFANISILITLATTCLILLAVVGTIAFTFFAIWWVRKKIREGSPAIEVMQQPFSAGIPQQGGLVGQSLKAHSDFIKRVNCSQCGAPKTLPSKTAYLYCDFCGSLMDYDFRLANANTNAALTNTVYHRIFSGVEAPMAVAKANRDWDTVRRLYTQVYDEWLRECPLVASPRAEHDPEFRRGMLTYLVESAVTKDRDPDSAVMEAEVQRLTTALVRNPAPGGAWKVSGPFWEFAQAHKKHMELVYDRMEKEGVLALDPDHAPPGVQLRMEFSTFAQMWLPHLSTEEGQRLLKLYGLSGEYSEVKPFKTDTRKCGVCGSEMQILPGARHVMCDTCYHPIDVQSQPLPCRKCGAPLSLPVDADRISCPYCSTENRRV